MILDEFGRPLQSARASKPRPIQARYDSAQTADGDRRHWAMADSLSAVSANSAGVRQMLRDRSRYEIANNSYARGILNTIAAYTVGTGPTLQLTYRGAEVTPEITSAARYVEQLWQTWAYARDLAAKLHTMQLALDGDGEAFGVLTSNQQPSTHTPITLDLRLYEADHFDDWSGSGIVQDEAGVRIDDSGRVTEYAFLPEHPGGAYSVGLFRSQWISADQVVHIFRCERPEQLRGIPRTTPALPLFALLRRFALATCTAAETAANFAAILTPAEGEGSEQAEPWDRIEIERNAFLTVPGGSTLSQLRAEHPASTYDDFARANLREIARCMSVPAVIALGDASRYNYASGRLDLQAFIRQVEVERGLLLERKCLDRLYEEWLDEALLIAGFLPDAFVAVVADFEWGWRWQGLPHVDRKKEADGQTVELSNHTTTLAREYARQGLDWENELRQRARELSLMQEIGISTAPPAAQSTGDDDGEMEDEEADGEAVAQE